MVGLLREPRILIGISVMLLATALGAVTMQRASARTAVWQLDHAVAAGTAIRAADVHLEEVAGDVGAYAPAKRRVVGAIVNRALTAGELLPVVALGGERNSFDEVMVPATSLHMPDELSRGEVVDVWLTTEDPKRTVLVLPGLRVVRTITADVGGGRGVALAVSPDLTGGLVAAIRSGEIDLVRVSK